MLDTVDAIVIRLNHLKDQYYDAFEKAQDEEAKHEHDLTPHRFNEAREKVSYVMGKYSAVSEMLRDIQEGRL